MSLLSPWGLWWLLTVPLLVTFYLFRPEPRRRLSTTFFLWRRSVPESQGGVYAKRLRSNPLLWLQMLVLILLALYLARPATSWSTLVPTSEKVVIVIDRSASMNAGGAFEQAVERAQTAVDGMFGFANFGSQPEVMLLAVDKEPQILVPFTNDTQQLRSALAALKPTEVADRLRARPFLASLVSDQKATVWLFGDHLPAELEISGLQFTSCGTEVAVSSGLLAFSVELSQEGGTPKPFVYARVQNFSASAEQRLLRVEKMSLEDPDQVDSIVVEASLLLPAGGGQTLNQVFPAARLSTSEPSLFRARLLPVPGATTATLDGFETDDVAYTIAPPYGQQRVRVSVTPDLKASFLVRALMATHGVEVLDWERLLQQPDELPLDLLICAPNARLPAKPLVRTRFEVSEAAPAESTPVEVLRANPDQPLVKDAGAEWSRLRVQRDPSWPVGATETTLLSTTSGPALTLKGIGEGQPTLCWRFPLSYSSLPLSPALPVLVGRFLDEYSRPASLALPGSLTTNERHSRPAGASWKGGLEIQPVLTSPLAEPSSVDSGDRQLPRLGYTGFYQTRNDGGATALLAANLFSSSESQLPRTAEDRSFDKEQKEAAPVGGQEKRQYRESTTPLAALALLILLIEAAVFFAAGATVSLSFTDPLALALLLCLVPLVRAWVSRPNALTPQRKRVALVLRCLTVLCLVLALAGAQMVTLTNNVTVVFLMDRSLSTGGDSQGWQREFAAASLRTRQEKDQYGIVLFGKDARIELPSAPHDRESVDAFSVVVDRSASGMTSALRFAATAFPGDSASRLVVLSDGQSTEAETGEEAAALAAAGIEVWTVPLPDSQVKDLLISRLEAPNQIAVNEPFVLRTVVESAGIGEAELVLSANGKPLERVRLKLRDGPNLFLIPQRVKVPGPLRYEARVIGKDDQRPENNKGEALLLAGDEQSVVVLRSQPGPGSLVPLLQKAGLKARAVTPAELPRRVGAWRDTSALVIEDVSAIDWSLDLQKIVSLLVRDGGMGLVMLGSDATFGVGGYQHTAIEPLLPVTLAIRRPKDMPLAALVQCLDKSGSMGGRPIEMAREAAIAAGDTLSEKDLLGLVAFDDASRWVYPFQEKGDGQSFKKKVASLRAGGGTDMYPGLKDAIEALEGVTAPLKHVIVLSDGATAPADFDGLTKRAVAGRITVSAVALGSGADITFLTELTKNGRGRLYVAPEASASSPLPQIFIRETLLATGSGVNEKPTEVRPTADAAGSPLLEGLEFRGTPPLAAYNMSSAKGGTASTLLQSPKKDPILAVGRAGLGRTAAWTSDMGGIWAASWMSHPGVGGISLLETILLRTVRSVNAVGDLGERSRGNQLEARALSVGDISTVSLRMVSREPLKGPVKVVVVNSRGESTEAVMHPETPFLATGSVQVTEPGSSLVFAQDPDGELLARCNLSVPLTPEFARLGTNRELLKELAQRSGGKFEAAASEVFSAPARPFPLRTPMGFDLIRGALLLLLLEIAVRRLPVPKARVKQTPEQLESVTAALRQQMSQLRETKRAVREPSSLPSKPRVQRANVPAPTQAPPPAAPPSAPVAPPSEDSSQSTMARLRQAKQRGKDGGKGV